MVTCRPLHYFESFLAVFRSEGFFGEIPSSVGFGDFEGFADVVHFVYSVCFVASSLICSCHFFELWGDLQGSLVEKPGVSGLNSDLWSDLCSNYGSHFGSNCSSRFGFGYYYFRCLNYSDSGCLLDC